MSLTFGLKSGISAGKMTIVLICVTSDASAAPDAPRPGIFYSR